MKSLRVPFTKGRLIWLPTDGQGSAVTLGREVFASHLQADHYRKGKLYEKYDLGSGLVTNAGVNMMANDPGWIGASTPFSTLNLMNYHTTGTGTTAAAASDYYIQTIGTHFSGSTNNYYTGTQTLTAPNVYKTVATVTYSGSEAVTEWGLFMSNAANFSRTETGTPTSTTFPDSGASFTTSGNGLKGWTIEINSTPINTSPTTTTMALVTSNTSTQLNMTGGWWHLDNSSASTPGASSAYVVYPTMWDHKVFSAINVNNTDTIQFSYSLTITSGG